MIGSDNTRRGFSTIEVLIVLAIAGILVTLSFGYLASSRPHALLERAELEVSSRLLEARNLAVSEEIMTQIVFHVGNQDYRIMARDRDTLAWSDVSPYYTLPEGVTFTTTLPSGDAIFTPRGTLFVGGSVTLTSSTGESSTLTGNLATGRFPILGGHLR